MKKPVYVKALIVPLVVLVLTGCPGRDASAQSRTEKMNSVEVSIAELDHMARATAVARRFLTAANRGDLKTARAMCSAKRDPNVPSVGDSDEVIGFSGGASFGEVWRSLNLRIVSVQYQRAQGAKGPYVLVWLRPAKKQQEDDSALVYKPSTGKIVSILDPPEQQIKGQTLNRHRDLFGAVGGP